MVSLLKKSSNILAVGKQKIFMTFVLAKNLGNLYQKNFSLKNLMWQTKIGKKYTLTGKVTIDTRMRIFQYKILNNILYLNRQLFCMKLADSAFCSLCGHCVETVTHLFLNCTVSQGL